ncbi:MAG: Maf family protein [Treponema sp.]
MEPVILASKSPQRQDILKNLNIPFIIIPSGIDETLLSEFSPEKNVEHLAIKKTEAVLRSPLKIKTPWIIGADTLIFIDGQPMGKPSSADEARCMLTQYSDRTHHVITALCCYDDHSKDISTRINTSSVSFKKLSPKEIDWYINLGEWQGAAGGYRIQGTAACFISHIEGSYSSIVGLPIYELYDILTEHGYAFN